MRENSIPKSSNCARVLITLLPAVFFAAATSSKLSSLVGVHPDDASLYAADQFKCKDGSQRIPLSKVNDDYCDCLDGSDEPGTSACSNGKFFCQNKGHKSKFIAASRVNDYICDCCDGSDEYQHGSNCSDRCLEEGAEIRRGMVRQIELHEQGLKKRSEYVETAAAKKQELEKRKEELVALIAEKTAALSDRVVKRDELQKVVDEEKRLREEAEEAARKAKEEEEAAAAAAAAAPEIKPAEDGSGSLDAEPAAPQPVAEDPAAAAAAEGESVSPAAESPAAEQVAAADESKGEDGDDELVLEEDKPEPHQESAPAVELSPAQTELEALKKEMAPVESEKRQLESELREKELVLSYDFAPDDAFLALYEKCFSSQIQQYSYEVCFYKNAYQKEGHSSQNLGSWGQWEPAGSYSVMKYTNGGSCWNGPSRSMKVNLVCGSDDYVVSVQEPARCEYHMDFMTPLACSQEAAEQARKELEATGVPVVV